MRSSLLRRLFPGWLLGMFTAALLAGVFGALLLSGLIFDTSASSQHSKTFAWAIHLTMIHSVRERAGRQERPDAARHASLLNGAAAYARDCVACHGGPGAARAPWVSAMLPTPPYLLDSSSRWSRAELYRLVHDGVKMSGMPAWGEIEPDQTISDIVSFVQQMPKLSPTEFARLRQQARPATPDSPTAIGAQEPSTFSSASSPS